MCILWNKFLEREGQMISMEDRLIFVFRKTVRASALNGGVQNPFNTYVQSRSKEIAKSIESKRNISVAGKPTRKPSYAL